MSQLAAEKAGGGGCHRQLAAVIYRISTGDYRYLDNH
jgi:hypothetical protein